MILTVVCFALVLECMSMLCVGCVRAWLLYRTKACSACLAGSLGGWVGSYLLRTQVSSLSVFSHGHRAARWTLWLDMGINVRSWRFKIKCIFFRAEWELYGVLELFQVLDSLLISRWNSLHVRNIWTTWFGQTSLTRRRNLCLTQWHTNA